jgi:hypothetical protein
MQLAAVRHKGLALSVSTPAKLCKDKMLVHLHMLLAAQVRSPGMEGLAGAGPEEGRLLPART